MTEVLQEQATGTTLKFRTKKFTLQHLLDKAAWAVPSKDFMEVLKNFQITVSTGMIQVTATDLELSIVAKASMAEVEKTGSALLPARRLLDIVREADDGDITITVKGDEAKVEASRTHWTLKLSKDKYPKLPPVSEMKFSAVNRVRFISAIRSVRYAAATDSVRPSLMLIDIAAGKVRASDGVRFQQLDVGEDIPLDFQIPINAVDDLLKILASSEDEDIEIGQDDNTLIFRVGSDVFLAQKLNAEFPDVNEFLLKPALANDQELGVDRQEFVSAIKRARITADLETSALVLLLEQDRMLVTSKDKYASTCVEEVDVKWAGPKRQVSFNHVHLLDMLEMSDAKVCTFFLGKDTKTRPCPILLMDEGAGQIGVLNQVRTDWLG